jgi:hypothetical protein
MRTLYAVNQAAEKRPATAPSWRPRSQGQPRLGWTPDQTEVWQASTAGDPHVYIWDMLEPWSANTVPTFGSAPCAGWRARGRVFWSLATTWP